jgi:hypothetical protein
MQLSRLLQQQQTQQQLHHQGDTEYLPAIAEALMLLREKEVLFEERCVKLGLSALLLPPPHSLPLPISATSTASATLGDHASPNQEKDREHDVKGNKNRKREKAAGLEVADRPSIEGGTGEGAHEVKAGVVVGGGLAVGGTGAGTGAGTKSSAGSLETTDRDGDNDREREGEERDTQSNSTSLTTPASTIVSADRRYAILGSSRLSPTSVPFVPSSSFALAPPAALSPPADTTVNEYSDPQLSPLPSSTPTTPLPSAVPSSPSSSLSLPRTAAQAAAAGTVSAAVSTLYHMFQSPQGDLIFLHPLCTKCLLASVHNDPSLLPHTVSGTVLETEKIRVNASLKQKIPFLRYLPEYCEVIFVELNMKDLVPQEVLSLFQEEFSKRLKKRKEKEKMLKKEKKIENDVMYVLCLSVICLQLII